MKRTITIALSATAIMMLTGCGNQRTQQTASLNEDSIKQIIMTLQDSMVEASKDAHLHPEKYEQYCEDSMLFQFDDEFLTSATALSHDMGIISVPPHDYTFRLFGNTALLSFLETVYEVIRGDTIFFNVRIMKTFAFTNGRWKMAASTSSLQQANYNKQLKEKHQALYPDYTGVYQINLQLADTVFIKDGKLYDRYTSAPETLNFPVSDSEYMVNIDLTRVVYGGKDVNGKVAYYTIIRPDGQRYKVPKVK